MKNDGRLSFALHVLLHLSQGRGAVTSETLGPLLKANPVVFRRTMAGLKKAGIVSSVKGHGGGWTIERRLPEITVRDVYQALGLSSPFRIGHRDSKPRCLLERAVNRTLTEALTEAETVLVERFQRVTVADVLADAGPASARKP
jgi:DNA-binding IscR family transcriptional regulator